MYLCALDGIPDEKLEEMIDWELAEIQEARTNFLQEKFQKSSEAEELSEGKIRQLQEQLSALQKENEELERMIKHKWMISFGRSMGRKKRQKKRSKVGGKTEGRNRSLTESTGGTDSFPENLQDDEEIIKKSEREVPKQQRGTTKI
ncbi:hypothetical protein FAEUMB_32090 [Faecalimonas umbilicata]|uniref:Transposase IS166 family protein n=1 Tax=Faecalimonas umbilicata TaxID=1912855 RepID=A0ABQ0R1X9_9FIRM|nr:hypothetical protein [Faecalimonas umbilicata]GBU06668.1 hypothetical protein FAEUMB_32090 [Faecalimonas umbilicata]